MSVRALVSLGILALTSCTRSASEPSSASLLDELQQRLTRRQAKVPTYHFDATEVEEGVEAKFSFAFRAPNRMRAELHSPEVRALSFDGEQIFEHVAKEQRFTAYKLSLTPEQNALVLGQAFSPFVVEGYRVPRFVPAQTHVKKVKHARAPEALEVRTTGMDRDEQVEVTYWLRWPALDFLGKRTLAKGREPFEVRVEEEHCERALTMCFPKVYSRWDGEKPAGRTTLTVVDINPPLPADAFVLPTPPGLKLTRRELQPATTTPQ